MPNDELLTRLRADANSDLEPGRLPRRRIGVGGFRISPLAKRLVGEVLDSGRITPGPVMAEFERRIASSHGCKHALMCNSGTSALQIGLEALAEMRGWADQDEVIVPAVTFPATANVVLHSGLRPVFVDVEADHYTLDPVRLETAVTKRTRAVIPVHIAGLPCDMDPISEIARKFDLAVVEDSAEAMFASYRGRMVGSFGEVGAFSTYAAHLISTGVGGLCTTNDDAILDLLKSLINHGRAPIYTRMDDDADLTDQALRDVVDSRFSFIRPGHSFRATEMEAALGLAELDQWEASHARRMEISAIYDSRLESLNGRLQIPSRRPDADHMFMFYPLVVTDPKISRDELVMHVEERGIETRYLLPLINQPVYRRLFGNLDLECPVAARLNDTAFYVGCHPEMTNEDAEFIASIIVDYFEKN